MYVFFISLSLLANGQWGWVQTANFIITGLLTLVGVVGMKYSNDNRNTSKINGGLLIYGLGILLSGIFNADPMNGFPPGTDTGNSTPSFSGFMHLIAGSVGFIGLIVAMFSVSILYKKEDHLVFRYFSIGCGIYFTLAFIGIATSGQQSGIILTIFTLGFYLAVLFAWIWHSIFYFQILAEEKKTKSR
jgi:hypothetical protein